ncbi:P pilus assembly/Cpx signaling pathway, periplasmic inhibitor/zinc-resistance associated protein [Cylindrospermum stagnale PCC 7417]|uniref:P pilus assembly/Cpx signaling pathway, periplasmic inhibitor/zinc-resistance associated protein n=1 Tax=Cylindrospermum stagnale PCC 7417 TaxID=56107 RepID=K9WW96_9NOST|nr:P pilus assembly/Cpx signaling pathway, periplasmic inhibitor/zinc-resistance associated protein [Cylindrospermum stagnale]AFZ24069.1 P pilus assembly/Cpx signaling pathway, periplasmic inhibitor/zinc-resistance associated protein [Cylindrospermum stagnale PCC 7417]
MMVASKLEKTTRQSMKLKTLSFIAGAIALGLTAIPFAVEAQTASSSPLLIAQAKGRGPWQKLNLTDAQKSQLKQIRESTRAQIDQVLTAEQKAQLEKLKAERQAQRGQGQRPQQRGERGKKGFAALNLSEDQKAQIKKIMESSKQQTQAVFTPEQLEQMKQFRENSRARRQQQKGPGV